MPATSNAVVLQYRVAHGSSWLRAPLPRPISAAQAPGSPNTEETRIDASVVDKGCCEMTGYVPAARKMKTGGSPRRRIRGPGTLGAGHNLCTRLVMKTM